MAITLADLIETVKSGAYEDVERDQQERLTILDNQLIGNYALILGQCLLNDIPADRMEIIYPKRRKLFDDIMLAVNTGNYGRTLRLVECIDKICDESRKDEECWPKKRTMNNILQWAADYFAWDDMTRAKFFGAEIQQPEEESAVVENNDVAEEVILDGSEE